MSIGAIAIICTVVGSLLGAGALVARAVSKWAEAVAGLRKEIVDLRLEVERARGADRLEVHQAIADALAKHTDGCPLRGIPHGPWVAEG